jgi:hypothetical protein
MANHDIVNGSRHHPHLWMGSPYITKRSLFCQYIKLFQQETEAEIAGDIFIDHHEPATQFQVA